MNVPYVYDGQNLTLVFPSKGVSKQINVSHPNFKLIKKELATGTEDELLALCDVKQVVAKYVASGTNGRAEVRGETVYFDGQPVNNVLAERIVQNMREGMPFEGLLRFIEKVNSNPSKRAVEEA